jgi:hypothetical protein
MNPTSTARQGLCSPAVSLAATVMAQLPMPPAGAIESWLLSAAAVLSLIVLVKKVLVRKPPLEAEFATKAEVRQTAERTEREMGELRERLDSRLAALGGKLDQVRADLLEAGERRAESIHRRLNELEAGLARVDERTKT